jgi:hypothetical protein
LLNARREFSLHLASCLCLFFFPFAYFFFILLPLIFEKEKHRGIKITHFLNASPHSGVFLHAPPLFFSGGGGGDIKKNSLKGYLVGEDFVWLRIQKKKKKTTNNNIKGKTRY